MTTNPKQMVLRTVYKQYILDNGTINYHKFDDGYSSYVYLSYRNTNSLHTSTEQRVRLYIEDTTELLSYGCHKAKIKLNITRTKGLGGKIKFYISETEKSTDAKTMFDLMAGGDLKHEITPTSTTETYEFDIVGESNVYKLIKYGINCNAEKTIDEDIIEIKITDVYVECEYYEIKFRDDLMINGGWYPEGNVMDYYQYVDKDFLLAWEYNNNVVNGIIKTEIKIHTYATNDGTPALEWILESDEYSGTVGQTILPIETWKRLPCGGWVEVVITTQTRSYTSELLSFDVPFHKVEILEPQNNTTIKYEVDNLMQWVKKDISGFVAFPSVSGYRILISTNNGATFDPIVEITGDIQEYLFREETLPVGVVSVRVVALYDNNTVAQNLQFGESKYIVGADAETSTVSCDGKPIPTVAWESVAQTAYQVKFGEYDSGAVYSADKYHKIPYIFNDGVYDVTVRTQISTGEWSEWSETVYVRITNVPPALGITATAEPAGYRVKVVWTKNSGYVDYIVYRNGVPIHVTDGGISTDGGYMDSMANGMSVYMVRGITADGYYDQSAEITVNAAVQTDILFALGSDEILPLKYTPVFPRTYNYTAEMAVTYRYFAGRSKPVAITSGQISRTLPLSYIDKGRTLARKLLYYVGKTVVFKDSGGDMIVGVLNMANAGMGHVSTTSFQITEVDHNERVAYLPGK